MAQVKAKSKEAADTLISSGEYELDYVDNDGTYYVKNLGDVSKDPKGFEYQMGQLADQDYVSPGQEAMLAADKQAARLTELFDPVEAGKTMEAQAQQTAGNVARKLAVAGAAGAGRPMGQAGIQMVANAAAQSLSQQKKDWVVAETQAFGQVMSAKLQAAGLMNQDRADKVTEMMATLQYLEANNIIDNEAEARRVGAMLFKLVNDPNVQPGQIMTLTVSYSD
tara:strand:- start:342 stop:1010 length:669 start_codon:yes stop_codon:yes gene_type:complete